MRPAKKTSPVKKPRGGGPPPRPRQQKKQVLGAFGERVPKVKGGRTPPKGSSAVKQRKLSPAALRSKRLKEKESLNKYAEALRKKRLKEKKATPIKPENIIDKTPRGGVDPRLTARRKRAAALRRRREAAAANKANRSAVRTDNKQAASDLAKLNAARKRQAKKAVPRNKLILDVQDKGRKSRYR